MLIFQGTEEDHKPSNKDWIPAPVKKGKVKYTKYYQQSLTLKLARGDGKKSPGQQTRGNSTMKDVSSGQHKKTRQHHTVT